MDLTAIAAFLAAGIAGGAGIYAAALALGIRHGIDWDHIAAITDITSSTAPVAGADESWLLGEPGLQISDESHHSLHGAHGIEHSHGSDERHEHAYEHAGGAASRVAGAVATAPPVAATPVRPAGFLDRLRQHREAIWLGTLYAIGHGTVVTLLGAIAIVASGFLPDWIDGVMERVVGLTLIFLSAYLFYSVYQYFRSGKEFRIRSRWMLVFAGVSNAWHWVRSRLGEHKHAPAASQQYGARAAYGIGLIHGIGAETGTQALIIATAVGATSKPVAVAALLVFVLGLLISNSFITLATTIGFVSARRRQAIYVAAGLTTAVLSLALGLLFLNAWTDVLPGLDQYVRWIGGPD